METRDGRTAGGELSTSRFVGREAELRELLIAAARAAGGHGSVAFVAGEAGIGKSSLVHELARRLAVDGFTVAWGVCPADGASAYWPWLQALRSLYRGRLPEEVRALVGEVGAAPRGRHADVDRFVVFAAVLDSLRTAASMPLALFLEDVHWADPASAKLLAFVAAELSTEPVLLVATYRDGDLDDGDVVGMTRPQVHLTLGGLAGDDFARAIALNTGEMLAEPLARAARERTGGNPFFAAEIIRLLRAEGRLDVDAVPGVLPASVRAVLDRRLARVPTPVVTVLQAAALLGDDFDSGLVAAVTGVDRAEAIARLRVAIDARLLRELPSGRYAFAHALVGETLRAGIPLDQSRRLHERAALALMARRTDVTAMARHALQAAALGGPVDAAVDAALVAARAAMRQTAYEEAFTLLRGAQELVATTGAERFELLMSLGEAAHAAGEPAAARSAYRDAAALAVVTEDSDGFAQAALGFAGGPIGFEVPLLDAEQIELLEDARRRLDGDESALCAAVIARLSIALTHSATPEHRQQLAGDAVAIARRAGDANVLAAALAAWCDSTAGPDDVMARLEASSEIVVLATAERDRGVELLGRRLRLVALAELGDWAAVDGEIAAYALAASRVPQPSFTFFVPLWRGMRALMHGELDEVMRRIDEARTFSDAAGSYDGAVLAMSQEFDRLFLEARFEEALEPLRRVIGSVDGISSPPDDIAVLFALCGSHDEATRTLDRLCDQGLVREHDSEWLMFMAAVAETALRFEHRRAAALVYERLAPYAGLFVIDGIGAACIDSVDGLLARLAPLVDPSNAEEHRARALDLDGRAGRLLLERLTRSLPSDTRRDASGSFAGATWRRESDGWALSFAGRSARVADSKGMRDLATLLATPYQGVHVSELVGGAPDRGDAGEVADRRAIRAYRRRLTELEDEIADARASHDSARLERVEFERDALLDELSSVAGLGNRPRRAESPVERMRKTVRFRVRAAIERVSRAHPELGRHLQVSVRTGTFCSYEPEQPVSWIL